MREVFHQSLEDVQNRLVEISGMVTTAIEKATTAFKTSDVALAEEVIAADAEIDDKTPTTDTKKDKENMISIKILSA